MNRFFSKPQFKALILVLLTIPAFFACKQNTTLEDKTTTRLNLTISMESGARTITTDTSLAPSYAEVTGTGPGSTAFTITSSAAEGVIFCTVEDLIPGSWEITTQVYNGTDILIGYGSTTLTLEEGISEHTLTVLPLEGDGTLNLEFTWDSLWVQNPSIQAALIPQDGSPEIPLPCTIEGGSAASSITEAAGLYTLTVQLYNEAEPAAGAAEAVIIFPGHTSTGNINLTVNQNPVTQSFTIDSTLYKAAAISIEPPDQRLYTGESCQFTTQTEGSGFPRWYLDGSSIGTGTSISLTAGRGPHRIDALTFGSDNYSGGSDSLYFSVYENILYGDIRFAGCQTDGENEVDGLRGVRKTAVSPDGALLAASGYDEDKLALFAIDPDTGSLHFLEAPSAIGSASCSQITALAFSSDGNTLFTASAADTAIHLFQWDPSQERLSFLNSIALPGVPSSLSLTGDDSYVAAASESSAEIWLYAVETETGTSTLEQTISGADLPGGILPPPDTIAFNSLSDTVGVSSFGGDSLVLFDFDSSSGTLTYQSTFTDGDSGIELFNGISAFTFSPEGDSLYAVSYYDNGISRLTRDEATGVWSLQETYQSVNDSYPGFTGLKDITMRSDGTELYICAQTGDSLIIFSREPATGALTYEGSCTQGENDITGLDGVRSVALNPVTGDVYTAASNSNTVTVFASTPD